MALGAIKVVWKNIGFLQQEVKFKKQENRDTILVSGNS